MKNNASFQSQEEPAYSDGANVWMRDDDNVYSCWKMTVQSSIYNYQRGGWDYNVKATNGTVHTGVAETKLRQA